MSLVYTPNDHGLLVASTRASGGEIARMLKEYDRNLRLIPQFADGRQRWEVWFDRGPSLEAVFVFAWIDPDGTPRPLSTGILDEARRHDKISGERLKTADQLNEEHRERTEKERALIRENIEDDNRAYYERGKVTVALSTKPRAPYWQRNHHLPEELRK